MHCTPSSANRHGLALWHHGHPAEALAAFEEAERINVALGSLAWIGAHRTNAGLALIDLDELDRAMERFAGAGQIHRELGTLAWAAVNYGGMGRALLMRGELEPALQMFRHADEISRRVYYPENISQHAGDIGRCLFLLGRAEEAREAVREAVTLERVIGATKDLRHFGNLVTLARVARQLGHAEECAEAVMRATELPARLKIGPAHRVRRVREDVAALEELRQESAGMEAVERRISSLLQRHGGRPLSPGELEEIERLVTASFDETSYEYPWTGLEDELQAQGLTKLRLFGYGSLVNQQSARRTFAGPRDRFVPSIAFGVIRLFNFEMPDVVRERYGGITDDDSARGLLNVQVTGFVNDLANGVVIEAGIDEIRRLREREVGYDLRPVVCIDWDAEGPRTARLTYVLTCPNRLWKGRPLTNAALRPYPPYFKQCADGAASFSDEFLGFWRETTYEADGRALE